LQFEFPRHQLVRSEAAGVVAGDGEDHKLVGAELLAQLRQPLTRLLRIAYDGTRVSMSPLLATD
jgi:hypothetical protein